jgi:riboflavin synthase
MFTGIVTAIGNIVAITALGAEQGYGKRLHIATPVHYLDGVAPGDSVAINGACMTVIALDPEGAGLHVDVSDESLSRTAGLDRVGRVNLELALRANDRLGGHLVAGHVDGIGTVTRFDPVGESRRLELQVPQALARFVAVKGSIVVNGVSLTVNRLSDEAAACRLEINLIPHTLQTTTLGEVQVGSAVNLEADLVARYVERLLSAPGA